MPHGTLTNPTVVPSSRHYRFRQSKCKVQTISQIGGHLCAFGQPQDEQLLHGHCDGIQSCSGERFLPLRWSSRSAVSTHHPCNCLHCNSAPVEQRSNASNLGRERKGRLQAVNLGQELQGNRRQQKGEQPGRARKGRLFYTSGDVSLSIWWTLKMYKGF